MKTAREILDNIKAEEELVSRGYRKERCKYCCAARDLYSLQWQKDKYHCQFCGFTGWTWKAPVTK